MTQSVHRILGVQLLFWRGKEAPVLNLATKNNGRTCKQKVHSATEIVKDYRKAMGSNINMKVKEQESDG